MPTFAEEVPLVEGETFPTVPTPQPVLEVPNKWIPSPQLRGYLYGIVIAVVPLLSLLGLFTPEVAQNILVIAAAVLAVGGSAVALVNRPKLTVGDIPEVSVKEAAENVDHALVTGGVKPVD